MALRSITVQRHEESMREIARALGGSRRTVREVREGRHRYNRELLKLAEEFSFRPQLCRPYRAKTKGPRIAIDRPDIGCSEPDAGAAD
jgi:hypothetical protein